MVKTIIKQEQVGLQLTVATMMEVEALKSVKDVPKEDLNPGAQESLVVELSEAMVA